jgi:leucyl aminopeptidase
MSTLKASLSFKKMPAFKGDDAALGALVVALAKGEKGAETAASLKAPKELDGAFEAALSHKPFKGAWGSVAGFYNRPLGLEGLPYAHLIVAGVGTSSDAHAQNALVLGAKLAQEFKSAQLESVDLFVDSFFNLADPKNASTAPADFAGRPIQNGVLDRATLIEKLAVGLHLGAYGFDSYKSKKTPTKELSIRFISRAFDEKRGAAIVARASVLAESVYVARDLMNTPANDLRPADLAAAAADLGKKSGFKTTIWDEKKLKSEGMNGILFVGMGSEAPPRLITMEHNGSRKDLPTLVLVGKGITFDTGGISIKPAAGMEHMKHDMGGAANVIAAMYGIAKTKVPARVIGIVASAENMPSGSAGRPGDIYTAFGGITVEVLNTDAEGRLVLGDALHYAKQFNPDAVIDIATLTGAVLVGLGGACSGIMGNNGSLIDGFAQASHTEGERVWELPLYEVFADDMKSKIADLQNIGSSRNAGSQKGGAFLNFFVDGAYPWLHVDIAGVMDATKEQGAHCAGGATGIPTRSLIEFATNFKTYFKAPKRSAKQSKAPAAAPAPKKAGTAKKATLKKATSKSTAK